MTPILVTIPKDGRLSLARFGVQPHQLFSVSEQSDGSILLVPLDTPTGIAQSKTTP